LGDRLANLSAARSALEPLICLTACSAIYETPPWGVTEQPKFLNQVIQAHTYLHPYGLLARLKSLEVQMGRQPTVQFGPRLIDIDILFYNNWVINSPILTIPHPRLTERAFVLLPLAEIAPQLYHPLTGLTISDHLSQVDCSGISKIQEA
jgi:2-amino-4-hydroxy-6-hydroxymethyldihydropteridine diphosphokinase